MVRISLDFDYFRQTFWVEWETKKGSEESAVIPKLLKIGLDSPILWMESLTSIGNFVFCFGFFK